ncbi:Ig-like domain-containing protein [Agromyces albus]|uniref:Ig-like domain-containing protein n=1 Tax=Agromyces albus TaxID=205332 RepID=UPI0027D7966C|nr:Ig-like domain-containing protein [Agromyces albus]
MTAVLLGLTAATLSPVSGASAAVPTTDAPPTYDRYQAVTDPGLTAPGYFQPYWYDTEGRHIQAHGGQLVAGIELGVETDEISAGEENGRAVYYWYGEDRSNGYYNSPGVAVYKSYDTLNWSNEGVALRSVTSKTELQGEYFDALYDTVDDAGNPNTATIDELFYYLNVSQFEADGTTPRIQAIFERPKALYNSTTQKWVMWWHADGSTSPGGSNYARSLAAVATSDSPTGPFTLQGAFRLYNEPTYRTACNQNGAVPGGARDMTVFQDTDGNAYVSYSSEENRSLYIAKLNAEYTNVEKTTTTDPTGIQFSADGRYPYIFADGTAGAPQNHVDYTIVKRCGLLEAPAIFVHDGRYYLVASGATGWRPNPQTYYTADSILGGWIRGVQPGDAHEAVSYDTIPEGGDGLLSVGDSRKTSFGSQSTNVFPLDAAKGHYIYMGDRWNSGAADSTYVWLPITIGEDGRLQMRNPAAENAKWATGWDASYWDDKGAGPYIWNVTDAGLPATARTNQDLTSLLPATVEVTANGQATQVPVTWNTTLFTAPGRQTITGTLAADGTYTAGRTFTRTIDVEGRGLFNIAPAASAGASSRTNLAATTNDGSTVKGWDDWATNSAYPLSSWLSYTWNEPRTLASVKVHAFKDGSTATWPSKVAVQYRNGAGQWVDTSVSATVEQNNASPAPVIELDVTALPATTAIRLNLTTQTRTWQSISEVEIFGYGSSAATALSDLQVDGATVPGFSPATWSYTVVGKNPAERVVTATPGNVSSRVSIVQASAADPFAYATVAEFDASGIAAVQTYRVGFITPATDATLSSITVNGQPLTGFSPGTTSYDGIPIPDGSTPTVAATTTDGKAIAAVGAFDPASGKLVISVTAEDPAVTKTYTLGFTYDSRSTDASLGALTVNGSAVAGFSPDTLAYTVPIGAWGAVPVVEATARTAAASVTKRVDLSTAVITVTAEHPSYSKRYVLTFSTPGGCADTTIDAPWRSAAWGTAANASFCEAAGSSFRISDANDGAWTTKDNLSVISQPEAVAVGDAIETYVSTVDKGSNTDPRAGLVLRNDLTIAGKASAKGYVILTTSPMGAYLQFDANNNGYIDAQTTNVAAGAWPVHLKLEYTSSTTATGYYRTAASDPWKVVGTATLSAPDAKLDAGVFAAGNNGKGASVASLLDTRLSPKPVTVTSVDPVAAETTAGVAPVLPPSVTVGLSDGSTESREVTWDAIDAAQYAAAGSFSVHGSVAGTEVASIATVTVHPAAVTVTSVVPVSAETTAGQPPVLPGTVIVVLSDDSTEPRAVVWPDIPAESYATAGSFTIEGSVDGTELTATATITVSAAPVTVTSIPPVEVQTTVGTAPELPAAVPVVLSDGGTEERAVVWEPVEPSAYEAAGSFTVSGSVEGTELRAAAVVSVTAVPFITTTTKLDAPAPAPGKPGTAVVMVSAADKTTASGTVIVTVYRGSEVVATATAELAKGKAKLSIAALPVGAYSVVAEYQGTSTFKPSSSPSIAYVIGKAK